MCPFCELDVENEVHCLLYCTFYDATPDYWFQNMSKTVSCSWLYLTVDISDS